MNRLPIPVNAQPPMDPKKFARLAAAKDEIVKRNNGIDKNMRGGLECAIEIGHQLSLVKGWLGHGEFEAWCRRELPINKRTAQHYMKFYACRDKLKYETVSHLGIREAIKLLRVPNKNRGQAPMHKGDVFPFDRAFTAPSEPPQNCEIIDVEPEEAQEDPAPAVVSRTEISLWIAKDGYENPLCRMFADEPDYINQRWNGDGTPAPREVAATMKPGTSRRFRVIFEELKPEFVFD